MAYLTSVTQKRIKEALKEFDYASEKEFIEEAVKEKLRELKKLQFFSLSEKIRKELEKKGIKPEDILKEGFGKKNSVFYISKMRKSWRQKDI